MKATKKMRITQIHGSMTAQDALSMVQKIARQRKGRKDETGRSSQNKEENKNLFYRCREVCSCQGICKASQLKECQKCKYIMKSQCSKAGCRCEYGTKPKMNVPAKATHPKAKRCRRALLDEIEDVSSEENEPEEEFLDDINEDSDEEIELTSKRIKTKKRKTGWRK